MAVLVVAFRERPPRPRPSAESVRSRARMHPVTDRESLDGRLVPLRAPPLRLVPLRLDRRLDEWEAGVREERSDAADRWSSSSSSSSASVSSVSSVRVTCRGVLLQKLAAGAGSRAISADWAASRARACALAPAGVPPIAGEGGLSAPRRSPPLLQPADGVAPFSVPR